MNELEKIMLDLQKNENRESESALSNAVKGEKSLGAIFIRKKQDTNKRYIKTSQILN